MKRIMLIYLILISKNIFAVKEQNHIYINTFIKEETSQNEKAKPNNISFEEEGNHIYVNNLKLKKKVSFEKSEIEEIMENLIFSIRDLTMIFKLEDEQQIKKSPKLSHRLVRFIKGKKGKKELKSEYRDILLNMINEYIEILRKVNSFIKKIKEDSKERNTELTKLKKEIEHKINKYKDAIIVKISHITENLLTELKEEHKKNVKHFEDILKLKTEEKRSSNQREQSQKVLKSILKVKSSNSVEEKESPRVLFKTDQKRKNDRDETSSKRLAYEYSNMFEKIMNQHKQLLKKLSEHLMDIEEEESKNFIQLQREQEIQMQTMKHFYDDFHQESSLITEEELNDKLVKFNTTLEYFREKFDSLKFGGIAKSLDKEEKRLSNHPKDVASPKAHKRKEFNTYDLEYEEAPALPSRGYINQ